MRCVYTPGERGHRTIGTQTVKTHPYVLYNIISSVLLQQEEVLYSLGGVLIYTLYGVNSNIVPKCFTLRYK